MPSVKFTERHFRFKRFRDECFKQSFRLITGRISNTTRTQWHNQDSIKGGFSIN